MARGKKGGKLGRRARKAVVAKAAPAADIVVGEIPAKSDEAGPSKAGAFAVGQRVKVTAGEYASTRGLVESVGAGGVTVRAHARLVLTVPANELQAI